MGRSLLKSVPVESLALALNLQWEGLSQPVTRVDSTDEGTSGALCFAKNASWLSKASPSCVLLTVPDLSADAGRVTTRMFCKNARLDFARALGWLEAEIGFAWSDAPPIVHPTAVVASSAYLGPGVVIGANTRICHGAVIERETQIGANCLIKSHAVIGEEGFGFERDDDGAAVRLPHIGGVIIGNNVEIGALTTVCRGTLRNTEIHDGAKIDDHVHIAHNVIVKRHAFVIACAEVSGGVVIGERAWVAPNASILNQLHIGDDALIGLGGVVVKSVPANDIVVGNPAKSIRKT
jgi:UDP-3-O-[3-hydroxymyristoyl] glucosamine N-acyltransferase